MAGTPLWPAPITYHQLKDLSAKIKSSERGAPTHSPSTSQCCFKTLVIKPCREQQWRSKLMQSCYSLALHQFTQMTPLQNLFFAVPLASLLQQYLSICIHTNHKCFCFDSLIDLLIFYMNNLQECFQWC